MSWRQKRKATFAAIAALPFVLVIILFVILYKPQETCFDGKHNQGEEGIDCGGVCGNICQASVPAPRIEWVRLFPVVEDYWAVSARIKHPMPSLVAHDVSYVFKFYDESGIIITEQTGTLDIPEQDTFMVFDTGIKSTNRTPVRATFEFIETPLWEEGSENTPQLSIRNAIYFKGSTGSRVNAEVMLRTVSAVRNVTFVAVLYDRDNVAYQAAQTFVERLDENISIPLTFTWPYLLSVEPSRIEILVSSFEI